LNVSSEGRSSRVFSKGRPLERKKAKKQKRKKEKKKGKAEA